MTIVQDENPSITHTWTNFKFGDFSDWVNVFKPGKGTITIYENTGGTRGKSLYQLKGIPLTPGEPCALDGERCANVLRGCRAFAGPLVVVIKVASSVVKEPAKYWPPALPDAVETIAASYVQTATSSKVVSAAALSLGCDRCHDSLRLLHGPLL